MPAPREQPNPPNRSRRRQDVMPGGWLWLVLLILLVLVLLMTFGFGSATVISYSQFMELAKEGSSEKSKENTIIKKVVFIGSDRIEGELQEGFKPTDLKLQQLARTLKFTTKIPEPAARTSRVIEKLEEYHVPMSSQDDHGAWISQLLMFMLPAIILLAIFFFFLLPRFRDPLGGGFL